MQTRSVAILRGYLSALEEDINKDFNHNVLIWNNQLIDEYFSFKKFRTNNMSKYVFLIPLASVIVYCFYRLFDIYSDLKIFGVVPLTAVVILEILYCILFGLVFVKDLYNNGKIRASAKEYAYKTESLTVKGEGKC